MTPDRSQNPKSEQMSTLGCLNKTLLLYVLVNFIPFASFKFPEAITEENTQADLAPIVEQLKNLPM